MNIFVKWNICCIILRKGISFYKNACPCFFLIKFSIVLIQKNKNLIKTSKTSQGTWSPKYSSKTNWETKAWILV